MGGGPTLERGRPARMHSRCVPLRRGTKRGSMGGGAHPGARASRPHALPLRTAQFPCDEAPRHQA